MMIVDEIGLGEALVRTSPLTASVLGDFRPSEAMVILANLSNECSLPIQWRYIAPYAVYLGDRTERRMMERAVKAASRKGRLHSLRHTTPLGWRGLPEAERAGRCTCCSR